MLITLLTDLAMAPSRGHELCLCQVLDIVMFWKFNLLTTHIDTLLDKEDVTLQELLDEDDVLQECKAQNRRLVDFLARPENIEELVNLVTQEPPDETDEKCRYKYPNTACELLTSDVPGITDKLITEDALLNKIYAFLEAEGPLNFLMASFFSKVMGLLITRKSEVLLHHLGTSAIMDLLLRLITCIESPECRNTCITWLNEQQLVQKLVAMIDGSQTEEKHCNASQSLCDIIRLSREQMSLLQEKADADPLLTTIESKETVSELLSHMLDGERIDSVIVNGLSVIQTLLEFKKTGPEGITEQLTMLDADRLTQGISSTLDALMPRLKDIHRILVDAPKQYYSPMRTTFGLLDPPLGNARLQVAHLVASLLARNSHTVNAELASLGTIQTLWIYPFTEIPEEKRTVWEEFVTGKLANLLKQNTVELVRSTGLHSSSEDDDPDFRDIAFPSDTAMQNAFSDYQLHQMTSNFIDQFGFNDDEFTEQDENINYSERISSINFDINTSGDSSHAATLFEQACTERMQQFDDADSDEDLWEEKELTFSSASRQNNRKAAPIARSDGSHGDSDSSDSEEELDSPLHIHQSMPAPSSTSTAMEVDNSDNWANFNDVPMHIDSTPIAMDMTSSFSTISSGRPAVGTGDRAENWAQFDNINCDKSNTDEWNNSTSDVDNHLNSASSEANVASVVADITLEVVRDSADDTAVTTPQEPTGDMTPPDTSTDEKETETPKKTEAEVASGDNTVVPPCGKESPKSSGQDVSVDSSDGDVSSSVSPQQ
ncbi:hypothetical protein NP493_1108g00066, partial [Ridgeia piscesae]